MESPKPPSGGTPDGLPSLVRLIADRADAPTRHATKVCFFLGAGADLSSGGLTFAELKRQAIEELSREPLFDISTPDQIEKRFSALFLSARPDDRALLIESLFRKLQPLSPSDGYKLLVLLGEAGGVDAIITTNFDLMLERAQSLLGRDVFQVFAPGFARPYLISHPRYELPKRPYLKLHGDLASRSVTLLTSDELALEGYDRSMLELMRSILRTHDLVIAGYGGFDPALARLVADSVNAADNRVFWCGPHPPEAASPLYSAISSRVTAVRATFDSLMLEVARPVLERPSLAPTEPTYLRCLFEWRVDYCNRQYLHAYAERGGKSTVDLFARRTIIEERLASFLLPNRPLAVIAGPSGFGKTTIGVRLHKLWSTDGPARVLLIRSRALAGNGNLEEYLMEQLGGLGSRGPLTLFRLERWLRENGLKLVLFVDGVNEFSPDLSRCVQFFQGIVRFCSFLPERESALRVVVTVRQETWNAMIPHVDLPQLRATLWADGGTEQTAGTLPCSAFSEDELRDALARLRERAQIDIDVSRLSPAAQDRLRDPYLLSMIAQASSEGIAPNLGAGIYQRVFEARLRRRGSLVDLGTLKAIFSAIAAQCLASRQDRFRETDVQPAGLRGDFIREAKDLGIIVDAEEGFLQFDHDRTFEYFLALAFASGAGPPLETLNDLGAFLRQFKGQSRALAAARLHYQLAPKERFRVIAAALRLADSPVSAEALATDQNALFGFARDVLIELVEQGESLAEKYIAETIGASSGGHIGEHHVRAVVHAAAHLPAERAVPLLTEAAHANRSLAGTEAGIFATDKLVKAYLLAGCPEVNLLRQAPYNTFLADPTVAPWRLLGRVLRMTSQLGPDNTNPDEYERTARALERAVHDVCNGPQWGDEAVAEVSAHFLSNCDRLLFNATPHGIQRFFGNPRRADFQTVLDNVVNGVLSASDWALLEPYTQSLAADVEYHLAHVMFALSSLNDLDATLAFTVGVASRFSNSTPPEEVDFIHAVLVYLHVLHGKEYDSARFAPLEDRILRDWPDVLMYRPGLERGERRGFVDQFDRVFEDGFGVIYPYGVLSPSRDRVRQTYRQYLRDLAERRTSPLPLYTEHLDRFLQSERIEEALQVLQALAGVIVRWPAEGLLSLRSAIGVSEPRIRRATVRILAEAFQRHPEDTMRFLRTSGVVLSDDELLEIRVRQDARVGRRQVDEEEWARIAHLLLRTAGSRERLVSCLRLLLRATSVDDAIAGILQQLGLARSAAL